MTRAAFWPRRPIFGWARSLERPRNRPRHAAAAWASRRATNQAGRAASYSSERQNRRIFNETRRPYTVAECCRLIGRLRAAIGKFHSAPLGVGRARAWCKANHLTLRHPAEPSRPCEDPEFD